MDKERILQIIVGVTIAGLLGWVIWFSVSTEEVRLKIDGVQTIYIVKATAEYSETHSGYDIDGDYYSETDTWSEEASEKVVWYTYDGVPENVRVPDPPLYRNIDRGFDFDGIQWRRSLTYTLKATHQGKVDTYDLTKKEYKRILNRTDDYMKAKINGWGMIREIK